MSGINVSVDYDERAEVNAIEPVIVTVKNEDALPIAVKVLTRNVQWYIVSPPKAYVAPRSECKIEIKQAPPVEFDEARDDAQTHFATGALPDPNRRPASDIARIEVRAMVSTASLDVRSVPMEEIDRRWKQAIVQDPHTVQLKLGWTEADEYISHRRKQLADRVAEARKVAAAAVDEAVAAEASVEATRNRLRSTEGDIARAAVALEAKRSVIGVPLVVALLGCCAAFSVGTGGNFESTIKLFVARPKT